MTVVALERGVGIENADELDVGTVLNGAEEAIHVAVGEAGDVTAGAVARASATTASPIFRRTTS